MARRALGDFPPRAGADVSGPHQRADLLDEKTVHGGEDPEVAAEALELGVVDLERGRGQPRRTRARPLANEIATRTAGRRRRGRGSLASGTTPQDVRRGPARPRRSRWWWRPGSGRARWPRRAGARSLRDPAATTMTGEGGRSAARAAACRRRAGARPAAAAAIRWRARTSRSRTGGSPRPAPDRTSGRIESRLPSRPRRRSACSGHRARRWLAAPVPVRAS